MKLCLMQRSFLLVRNRWSFNPLKRSKQPSCSNGTQRDETLPPGSEKTKTGDKIDLSNLRAKLDANHAGPSDPKSVSGPLQRILSYDKYMSAMMNNRPLAPHLQQSWLSPPVSQPCPPPFIAPWHAPPWGMYSAWSVTRGPWADNTHVTTVAPMSMTDSSHVSSPGTAMPPPPTPPPRVERSVRGAGSVTSVRSTTSSHIS